jgi:BirA family transcriptional regulator, biotin operon repressor / biotin---[acetyl-CoA-carboxylase] ligase
MEIIHKEITGSTNDDIAELARLGHPSWTTVVADFQTRGRGRRGNQWEAPRGNHLLFSVLLRPTIEPIYWSRIPQAAGMLLIETIESLFYPDAGIKMKWPNDLYYYDRKWCGILVESKMGNSPHAILGMGVNCRGSHLDYPEPLQKSVTTLEEMFHVAQIDPLSLLQKFHDHLVEHLDNSISNFSEVVKFASQRDYLFGKQVTVAGEGSRDVGTACGIGPDGELLTLTSDGVIRRSFSGTVLAIE